MSDICEAPSAVRNAKSEDIEASFEPKSKSKLFCRFRNDWETFQDSTLTWIEWSQECSYQDQKDQRKLRKWWQSQLQIKSFLQIKVQTKNPNFKSSIDGISASKKQKNKYGTWNKNSWIQPKISKWWIPKDAQNPEICQEGERNRGSLNFKRKCLRWKQIEVFFKTSTWWEKECKQVQKHKEKSSWNECRRPWKIIWFKKGFKKPLETKVKREEGSWLKK